MKFPDYILRNERWLGMGAVKLKVSKPLRLLRSKPLYALFLSFGISWSFPLVAGAQEVSSLPITDRDSASGIDLFHTSFPNAGNARSCASCHVPEENFTLPPDYVEALWQSNPNDPLFSAIDADDPEADDLTFNHLRKGLIRIWITLPDNMDQIDSWGRIITPEDRRIFVWRSVPSIADVGLTAPFQLDGRAATLEDQAQGAILSHSEGLKVPPGELERIAEFQRSVFTSDRSEAAFELMQSGLDFSEMPDLEATLDLNETERRGKEVYQATCAPCHGGGNLSSIIDREIHALAFPKLTREGFVEYQVPATNPPTPVYASLPENEFINIGSAMENFLVQIGATEHDSFTKDLSFPQYRFRFYADDRRSEAIADLPPELPLGLRALLTFAKLFGAFGGDNGDTGEDDAASGGGPGNGGLPGTTDRNGNPRNGPNLFPVQMFTTDPGRAAITGNPYDFEAFDIPTMRGISRTAPYWHNNISRTLEDVINLYSDHLLVKFPPLIQEGQKQADADGDIGPVGEALTEQQKTDLLAYLNRL